MNTEYKTRQGSPTPEKMLPDLRQTINPTNAAVVMSSWVDAVSGKKFETRGIFDRLGFSSAGVPSTVVLHPLYLRPNVFMQDGKTRVCTVTLGLEKNEYDPKLDVEKHWQYLEPPEVIVEKGFEAFRNISQRGDVSMFWKMHAVLPEKENPFLCLNPVYYTHYWPQEQEYVEIELRKLLRDVEDKKPKKAWDIRNHLERALRRIQDDPQAPICRYPERDRLAVAISCHLAISLGLDNIALPSEETLRNRWPKITDDTVRKYKKLGEYAKTGKTNLGFYEFTPDLRLKPI